MMVNQDKLCHLTNQALLKWIKQIKVNNNQEPFHGLVWIDKALLSIINQGTHRFNKEMLTWMEMEIEAIR